MTNKTKHTPGPWYVPDSRDSIVESVDNETGYKIAIANCGSSYVLDDVTMQANSRLIAAAPELLEVCKTAVADSEKSVNPAARLFGYELFKAAITKAEGR